MGVFGGPGMRRADSSGKERERQLKEFMTMHTNPWLRAALPAARCPKRGTNSPGTQREAEVVPSDAHPGHRAERASLGTTRASLANSQRAPPAPGEGNLTVIIPPSSKASPSPL